MRGRRQTFWRWCSAGFLGLALGMLVAGLTVLGSSIRGLALVAYWLVCLGLTCLALLAALVDLRVLRRQAETEQRELLEQTLGRPGSGGRRGPGAGPPSAMRQD